MFSSKVVEPERICRKRSVTTRNDVCLCTQTGEGVKDSRKGICANHVSSIAAFLKVGMILYVKLAAQFGVFI